MIIRSINLTEGISKRKIDFSNKVNLIYSKYNSKGKTTLLRFILYALGYNIPNTKKIKFENCEVEIFIYSEKCGEISLVRNSRNNIILVKDEQLTTYILPEQEMELHSYIFGTFNADILKNILGAFYVDQEKGWTLLNRGIVIGGIHFNIEELIRGLSGRDCSDLIKREEKISRELKKYRQMFSVAKYQEEIEKEGNSLAIVPFEEKINIEYEQLLIQKQLLKKELKRIGFIIKNNKQFNLFVSEMKLLIKTENGNIIPITKDNIFGYNDNIDYLIARHKLISSELANISNKIKIIEDKIEKNAEQLSFWKSESILELFDRRIASLELNVIAISKEKSRLEKELKSIDQQISYLTKINNDIVTSLYKNVIKYAKELNIGNDDTIPESYIFTSNLKELSGALLHKTVFAFRLAYIIEIEKILKIKLPIILDSPSGKEIDKENIQLMINILKRDFSDNQIIIASIFKYDFDEINIINIKNRLIE